MTAPSARRPTVAILGTRGIPAKHGGFETFVHRLAPYLVGAGWDVSVYCQEDEGRSVWCDDWNGVRLVHVPAVRSGAIGTALFDLRSTLHARRERPDVAAVFGYNTGVFAALLPRRTAVVINMDGLEWKREKWGPVNKSWLWANEGYALWARNRLIADHPEIKAHLLERRDRGGISVIPYGADATQPGDLAAPNPLGLEQRSYGLLIARPEPENSVLEIVRAFSRRRRGYSLVVLGTYDPAHPYQGSVLEAASDEVIFPGAIYDPDFVRVLRVQAGFFMLGHKVGGTNPTLVESLAAGNPILAIDTKFSRWVAADAGRYFGGEAECAELLDSIGDEIRFDDAARARSLAVFDSRFRWEPVLSAYRDVFTAARAGAETPFASWPPA